LDKIFQPHNTIGFRLCGITVATLLIACALTYLQSIYGLVFWFAFTVQTFSLLHEGGHGTLFYSRKVNQALGVVCGLIHLIPFHAWQPIHNAHHIWAGWRNLDPTTAHLCEKKPTQLEKFFLEACRWLCLPFPALFYRFSGFWDTKKLKLCKRVPKKIYLYVKLEKICIFMGIFFLAIFLIYFGKWEVGVGYFFGLLCTQLITLSQHTGIEQKIWNVKENQKLPKPLTGSEQATISRSLKMPLGLSQLLFFGFESHELHHAYPKVPGPLLKKMNGQGQVNTKRRAPLLRYLILTWKMPMWKFLFEYIEKENKNSKT
jgi:acyl-lipid omega-6 desaturase (Delta-12 desaturase)